MEWVPNIFLSIFWMLKWCNQTHGLSKPFFFLSNKINILDSTNFWLVHIIEFHQCQKWFVLSQHHLPFIIHSLISSFVCWMLVFKAVPSAACDVWFLNYWALNYCPPECCSCPPSFQLSLESSLKIWDWLCLLLTWRSGSVVWPFLKSRTCVISTVSSASVSQRKLILVMEFCNLTLYIYSQLVLNNFVILVVQARQWHKMSVHFRIFKTVF